MIRDALAGLGVSDLSRAVMAGDREQDVSAAREAGIDSVGVLWGYGDEPELRGAGATFLASEPSDVLALVL